MDAPDRPAASELVAQAIREQRAVCPYVVWRKVGEAVSRKWLWELCRTEARSAGLIPFDVAVGGRRGIVVWAGDEHTAHVWLKRGLKELDMIKWNKHADRIIVTHMVAPKVGDEAAMQAAAINATKAIRLRAGVQPKVGDVEVRWAFLRSNGQWARLREWGEDEEQIIRTAFSVDNVPPSEMAAVAADCIEEQVGTLRTHSACQTRAAFLGCRDKAPPPNMQPRFTPNATTAKARLVDIITADGPKTAREIVEGYGISKTTVHKYLAELVKANRLACWPVDGDASMHYGLPEHAPSPTPPPPNRSVTANFTPDAPSVPQDMARRALRIALSTDNADAKALAAWAVGAANLSALDVLTEAMGAR